MKKCLVLLVVALFIFSACSNEKKDLYEKAIGKVRENLKAPSSAKFVPYDEKYVLIIDTLGFDSPDTESNNNKYEYIPYAAAFIKVDYEAQNDFGVFLSGTQKVVFRKFWYKDGKKGEWIYRGME